MQSCFRQICPSIGNVAANSKSTTQQDINVRKMKISAQVNFVIWILESFANLCLFIALMFIFGKSGPGLLITHMVWYHLILPYTYLMNTSDNRNLVIEDGWRNTLRNAFGILNKCNQSDIITTVRSKADSKPNRSDIFVTSKSRHIIPQSQTPPIELPNVLSEAQQGTSKICSGGTKVVKGRYKRPRSDSDSDTKSHRRSTGEAIFSYMLSNVENEDAYLHYFRQLISFEESLNHKDGPNSFDIVHVNYKQNKSKGKVKRSTADLNKEGACLTNSKNTRPEMLELKANLLGKQMDRIAVRKDMLENVYDQDSNDELYDEFLDRLIDLEEGLIEDTS